MSFKNCWKGTSFGECAQKGVDTPPPRTHTVICVPPSPHIGSQARCLPVEAPVPTSPPVFWNDQWEFPPIYSMGLGFDSTLVLGPQANPRPQFPSLEKGVNHPCLRMYQGCKNKNG